MKLDRSFAEILEGYTLETHANPQPVDWESSLDPHGLSLIIGKIAVFKTGHKKYFAVKKDAIQAKSHLFTPGQKLAFENLAKWSPSLMDNFNRLDLKSSYRAALLKTHPDQGGSSETFIEVKKSYEILRSLVKS